MAEIAVSVGESFYLFGGAPSNKWNSHLWGAFLWGEGNEQAPFGLGVGVSEAQASSSEADLTASILVLESVGSTTGLADVFLRDAAGYFHVFPNNTTDGEERDTPTWASGTVSAATWTAASTPAVTWS